MDLFLTSYILSTQTHFPNYTNSDEHSITEADTFPSIGLKIN